MLSSLVGNCGMFSAEFLEDTHQLEGMACVGLAPRIFQERSARFGTPVNAMLFQLFFLVLLVGLDFRAIMYAPYPASLPRSCSRRRPSPSPDPTTASARPHHWPSCSRCSRCSR